MSWTHSDFLDVSPDVEVDHRYLTDAEIAALPPGAYYKKKDRIARHRFAKFVLTSGDTELVCEAVDDRGYWRIEADELSRIARAAGIEQATAQEVLEALGLCGRVLAPDASLPDGVVRVPQSPEDIQSLYADYTDMHAQGHFDSDSPDLDRLELLTSWVADGVRTLDLGCNSGSFGVPLIARGCEVHGVDLSEQLVAAARARGVLAIRCWAEETPYEAGEFDAVICAELLEHALDPLKILREARRVLRADGLLIGSVPHADGPWGHEDMGHHPEHLWALEQNDLERMLQTCGFAPLEFRQQTHGTDVPIGLAFRATAV